MEINTGKVQLNYNLIEVEVLRGCEVVRMMLIIGWVKVDYLTISDQVGNVTKVLVYQPPTQAQLKAKLTSKPMQQVNIK